MKDEKDKDPDVDPQAQADQLEERLIDFAIRIIKLADLITENKELCRIFAKSLKTARGVA